ncbi:hypothetical protein NF681_18775 [Comamonadaceae bacterium OTU4NAUVB1]|nr:hypothetical protein NF681_18775 [Comamonadaceae bacterium OTU4NAUVB1]
MLLFFSVARSANTSQAERANEAQQGAGPATAISATPAGIEIATANEAGEKMPTDKLLDVSPLALRMSSPFNAEYWLATA